MERDIASMEGTDDCVISTTGMA
ncbi:MAG: hypothetical protein ACOCSE_06195, partial [Chitinivibrionales bacterium]